MFTKINKILSKHPYDWIVHFTMCFLASWFCGDIRSGLIIFLAGIVIEYEQKYQMWYYQYTWKEYIKKESLFDMIANTLGIIFGLLI